MNLVVALDTMAWIWALKPASEASDDAELHNCERASNLFTWLDAQGAEIVVPTVTVAELLTPLDVVEQNKLLALISRCSRPAVFDLHTAAIAARLYRDAAQERREQPDDKPARHVLRADTLIVASAKSSGATHFFTEDTHCRKTAKRAGLIALGLDEDPKFPLLSVPEE